MLLSTRVSESTLCLLGQSNKAIGHEPLIGPCVATHTVDNHQACCFRNDWRRHDREMEPHGRGSVSLLRTRRRNTALGLRKTTLRVGVHVQTVGLNAKTNGAGIEPKGEIFLLTFLFIGLLRSSVLSLWPVLYSASCNPWMPVPRTDN